jgi:hypothetical protein
VLPDVLASLARLPHTGIKNQIITHPNLPEEVFDELMADTHLHGISHERIANTPRLLTTQNYRIHAHRFESSLFMAYASVSCPATIKNGFRRQLEMTPGDNYKKRFSSG